MKRILPQELIDSLQNAPGFDEGAFIETHSSDQQITSIRLNPAKHASSNLQLLTRMQVPWSRNGYYLSERPSFTLDPLFHAGAYYVQEASSMFLEQALAQTSDLTQPLRILDLCAAPGGKSTLIQSLISSESLLVSNEIIKSRVNILSENLIKWGSANVVVTNNEPKDFQKLPSFFDVMVVDAPCSGSGLFRKDEDAIAHWSLDSVAMCARRQKDILQDALHALKPGGVLIYSTCSYSMEENEDVSQWLVGETYTPLRIEIKETWNIVETSGTSHSQFGYRFYPDKLEGEGFFIAAFRKSMEGESDNRPPKNKLQIASPKEIAIASTFVQPENLKFIKWQEHVLALPSAVFETLSLLQFNLYIKKAGVNVGSIVREGMIPHHELAMSTLIKDVPSHEVDLLTALDFLRKRDISVGSSHRGWILIKYQDIALGWIKNLGSRINNYYPKEWRILNK